MNCFEALNHYAWHLSDCDAYWPTNGPDGRLATEADNVRVGCQCGFRHALGAAELRVLRRREKA